jgi:N-methylhydantoinase B
MDAVDTLYANTRNNPIEDIETHLPLRVSRYELREDASGAGEWRGGLGSVREFEYLDDGGASVEADGHEFAPWAFAGGGEGRPAELRLIHRNGAAESLPSKVPHMRVMAGERFTCVGPAGGGYGDPLKRDPASVADDVADGFVSADTAKKDYGVMLTASGRRFSARAGRNARATSSPSYSVRNRPRRCNSGTTSAAKTSNMRSAAAAA